MIKELALTWAIMIANLLIFVVPGMILSCSYRAERIGQVLLKVGLIVSWVIAIFAGVQTIRCALLAYADVGK